jgi:hypothetical protein
MKINAHSLKKGQLKIETDRRTTDGCQWLYDYLTFSCHLQATPFFAGRLQSLNEEGARCVSGITWQNDCHVYAYFTLLSHALFVALPDLETSSEDIATVYLVFVWLTSEKLVDDRCIFGQISTFVPRQKIPGVNENIAVRYFDFIVTAVSV